MLFSTDKLSLRNKIMFSVLPLVVVALVVSAYVSVTSLRTTLTTEIRDDIKYKTESLADHVASWINMQKLNVDEFVKTSP